MLLAIRERVMGIVGWIILAILFVAFAFFGLNSYLGGSTAVYAASVNGVEISTGQENMAYQRLRARLEERLGDAFNPAMLDEQRLRADALNQLINDELLYQHAVKSGLAGSDQLLASQISSIDAFRDNGRFSSQRYERVLANQGMNSAQFEDQLRRGIIIDQLRQGIIYTAEPTREEVEQAYRLQGQKRRFRYTMLPVTDFESRLNVTDADIEEFYEAHGDEYMRDQKVKLQYVELDVSNLETGLQPDEETLKSLYEQETSRFTTEEERHARHILVLFKDSSEAQVAAATRKAQGIIKRLNDGEPFDALARELSDDPGSADKGGDLGFFTRGIMVPEFERAVFDMQIGERSEPVKSDFGLHIIELLGIKQETIKPYEEVREQLAKQLVDEERSDRFYEQSEVLSNLAFEHPETLLEAASTLGLAIRESGWLAPDGGSGIWSNTAVINAAFSDDVLLNGNNSHVIELGEGHVVVIRVADHQKAEPKPLEEVRDLIRQRLRNEKARAQAESKGRELLESLQDGSSLEDVASQNSLEIEKTDLVGRRAASPDRGLIIKAFSMAAPQEESATIDGFVLDNGSYAIIELQQVEDGRLDSLESTAYARLNTELGRIQGASDLQALMASLKSSAKIIIPDSDDRL